MLKGAIPATLIIAACSMPAYADCDFFSLDSALIDGFFYQFLEPLLSNS